MNGTTATSRLELCLATAQGLIGRGEQRRALDELWDAEAHARGNPEAIRELIDFTAAFAMQVEPNQASGLSELIDALRRDAQQASGAPETRASATGLTSTLAGVGVLVLVLMGAVGGAALGFAIGHSLDNPDSDLALGYPFAFLGTFVGFFVGGIALPLSASLLGRAVRMSRNRPG